MTPRPLAGQLLFLGTGTSHGVPVVGCCCPVCQSPDPRDRRTRCSVLVGLPGGNLLVDTPPDLHAQLIRERIELVRAVAFTHAHADHLFGLDDVRIFTQYLDAELPVYCEEDVAGRLRQAFSYVFDPNPKHPGDVPRLKIHPIGLAPLEILGARVQPIRLWHGPSPVLGFRIGDVAYCTDTNRVGPESLSFLFDLDVLVIDALRASPHPTHFSLAEALDFVRLVRPRRTLLTHICHDLGHAATSATLPPGVELAYDGLVVPLTGLGVG